MRRTLNMCHFDSFTIFIWVNRLQFFTLRTERRNTTTMSSFHKIDWIRLYFQNLLKLLWCTAQFSIENNFNFQFKVHRTTNVYITLFFIIVLNFCLFILFDLADRLGRNRHWIYQKEFVWSLTLPSRFRQVCAKSVVYCLLSVVCCLPSGDNHHYFILYFSFYFGNR